MAGELAQEQRLRLRQGRGGQHGSGSLATLLQAWGLCSRGETGEERSFGEVGASHCFSWQPRTCQHTRHELWQVSTPHRAAKIPISTSPPKPMTVSLQPIPSHRQVAGHLSTPGSTGNVRCVALGVSQPPISGASSPFYPLIPPQIRL